MQKSKQELLSNGAMLTSSVQTAGYARHILEGSSYRGYYAAALRSSFHRLPADVASARRRSFGRFAEADGDLYDREYEPYYEEKNEAVGDSKRRFFAEIEPVVRANPTLRQMVKDVCGMYRDVVGAKGILEVGVHLVRATGSSLTSGEPTPERIHRDGNNAFAAVLIDRDCDGGETVIYNDDLCESARYTMTESFEMTFALDYRIFHEVTSIKPRLGHILGHRDIVIIDMYDLDRLDFIRTNYSVPESIVCRRRLGKA